MLRASGGSDGELEVIAWSVLRSIGIQLRSDLLEQKNHVGGLSVIGRVLPVDVDSIEAPILHEGDGSLGKVLAVGIGACCRREVGGPGPATDRKHNLHVAVGLLQLEQLLHTAVRIVADVIPGCFRR